MTILELTKILYYASIVVWLLPPFRQYKGRFFYFFLILALMDPLFLLNNLIFKINFPIQISVCLVLCLLFSTIKKEDLKKYKSLVLAVTVIIVVLVFFGFNQIQNFTLTVIIQCWIFFIVLKLFITRFAQDGKINWFLLVFIFYELTLIIKFLNVLVGFADAIGFYIITSIAQIIFGLFFSFHREN